jgi:hypothetical protein
MVTSPAVSSLGLTKPLSLTSAFTIPPTAPLSITMPIGINIDVLSSPFQACFSSRISESCIHPLNGDEDPSAPVLPFCYLFLNNFFKNDLS